MCVSTYTIQELKLTLLVNRRQKKRLPATVLAFKLFPTHRSYLVYYYYSCGVQDYVNVVYKPGWINFADGSNFVGMYLIYMTCELESDSDGT